MTVGLFLPDTFSRSRPVFSEAIYAFDDVLEAEILETFVDKVGEVLCVRKIGGAEVNSTNLRISTRSGEFIAKKIPRALTGRHYKTCELAGYLSTHKVPVAAPIALSETEYPVKTTGGTWSLWRFYSGTHFQGGSNQLQDFSHKYRDFQERLDRAPSEILPSISVCLDPDDMQEKFEMAATMRSDWLSIFGVQAAKSLYDAWPVIELTMEQLKQDKHLLHATSFGAVHFDLHPHNLLMENDDLKVILDLDSLVWYPRIPAVGFGVFKLFRQHVVSTGIAEDPVAIKREFIQFCSWVDDRNTPEDLLRGAVMEVARRASHIIGEYLAGTNNSWQHVFEIQLACLGELQFLNRIMVSR